MKTLMILSLLLVNAEAAPASQKVEDEAAQGNVRKQSDDFHPRSVFNQLRSLIRTPRQVTLQEPKSTNHSTECCENGGTCILGSFCMCPGNFTGRYCERRAVTLACGDVPHNDWTFQGCSLCRCGNGTFLCIEHVRPDCGSERDVANVVNRADSLNTLSVLDLFDQSRNSSSTAQGQHQELKVTLLVSLLATIAVVMTSGHMMKID
ncbi:PREDICTED: teratocarcinoma-derived growth factor 1-like [Branchiostoma belcheri]|uniref:Teratocarcinoma-derived growth factor 1-like n=1 Tax=Branchiostoma belcheri TaxID=7741 RepID=A0A6P5AG16_BRABE|nr:PREDICTED: teratocarcinoma-derived growth factor 1-like [Branchiostoma belcheri]